MCGPRRMIRVLFFLLHSCSTTSVNSNSNHFACHHPPSLIWQYGWMGCKLFWRYLSSSWHQCFFFFETHKETTGEKEKKICFMISRLRRRVSGCVDSQISKENLQQNKQMRWPQSVKPWTSWETHFTLFWSRNIKSCWVWVLFWSCIREFMIDTPSVSVVPYLPQTQPV